MGAENSEKHARGLASVEQPPLRPPLAAGLLAAAVGGPRCQLPPDKGRDWGALRRLGRRAYCDYRDHT